MRSKHIFKVHITNIESILMAFLTRFHLKLHCFYICFCYFSLFSILFHHIYILVLCQVFEKEKLGKLRLPWNF